MFSTDFIFRQQENLVDNQKCQAGFRPLCNKILLFFVEKKPPATAKTSGHLPNLCSDKKKHVENWFYPSK